MKPGQPSDDLILETVASWGGGMMTYVVCNILRQKPSFLEKIRPAFPLIDTGYVRRRLMAMEKAGKVHRVPTSYAVQICWAATPTTKPRSAE